MMKDYEIVNIFSDVVQNISADLKIRYAKHNGEIKEITCPPIKYIFGNAQYVKDELDAYSKYSKTSETKFPLIALFCPIDEDRSDENYHTKAKISLIIACSSCKDWSNEQREKASFQYILRPIYKKLCDVLKEDARFDWGYTPIIKHKYSENYSYGRYGAYTEKGDEVSEPIDAINIRALEIKITKPLNCNRR